MVGGGVMPVMDGWESTRLIQQEAPLTAVVMITARTQAADMYRGSRQAVNAYLTKPFSPR